MALYVYKVATGALFSWAPNDTDPVAPQAELTARGLAILSGQVALDATHVWRESPPGVVTIAGVVSPIWVETAIWIMRFTPQEFSAIMGSVDPVVQQFVYALNHTTQVDMNNTLMTNGVAYLISTGLLVAGRSATIMAAP